MDKKRALAVLEKIMADEALKAEGLKAFKEGKIVEFAAKHGVDATEEELRAFVDNQEGEIPVDDLENYSAACSSNSVANTGDVGIILC